jgi:hypothetical protein
MNLLRRARTSCPAVSILTILKRKSPYSPILASEQKENSKSSVRGLAVIHAARIATLVSRAREPRLSDGSQSRRFGAALSRTGKRDVDRSEKPLAKSFARAIAYSRSSPSVPLFGTQTVIVMNSCSAQIVTWRLLRLDVPA